MKDWLTIAAVLSGLACASTVSIAKTSLSTSALTINENDRHAPIDYGYGPGKPRRANAGLSPALAATPSGTVPQGSSTASVTGMFGPEISWPIIGLHMLLLPDGRVLSYGTSETGAQTAQFIYDVWDPSLGTDLSAHTVLPNTTNTDLFCSSQSMTWQTGTALLSGGNASTARGTRNNVSLNTTAIFSPQTNTIAAGPAMTYARWYPTMLPLPDGTSLIMGGREKQGTPATIPELFDPAIGWSVLAGAGSAEAFGNPSRDWFYPRSFVAPDGTVVLLNPDGKIYNINPSGTGTITKLSQTLPVGDYDLPSIPYLSNKILSVREDKQVVIVDITNPAAPVVTPTAPINDDRYWASGTVLADDTVVVTGGSEVANELTGVSYVAELWDPVTGQWTAGASAAVPRLYHSNALLLPDATVLTGAGGAPGPLVNLNAEIFYPPYLYNADGTGTPALRPELLSAPTTARLNTSFQATVGTGLKNMITKVTFVRTGSATHSNNSEQRFVNRPFTQSGTQLSVLLPASANVMVPGYYMMFAFHSRVPSIAKIVLVTP